jgi:hypothetical protein
MHLKAEILIIRNHHFEQKSREIFFFNANSTLNATSGTLPRIKIKIMRIIH